MVIYVPGTEETDPKKQNISLQQLGRTATSLQTSVATNTSNIATNTSGIATNLASINAMKAAWTTYTPTVTAGSGTFGSVSATGAYLLTGKTVLFAVTVTITTVGTASGTIVVSLPTGTAKRAAMIPVGETALAGTIGVGRIAAGATSMVIIRYDVGSLISAGHVVTGSGVYEIA